MRDREELGILDFVPWCTARAEEQLTGGKPWCPLLSSPAVGELEWTGPLGKRDPAGLRLWWTTPGSEASDGRKTTECPVSQGHRREQKHCLYLQLIDEEAEA